MKSSLAMKTVHPVLVGLPLIAACVAGCPNPLVRDENSLDVQRVALPSADEPTELDAEASPPTDSSGAAEGGPSDGGADDAWASSDAGVCGRDICDDAGECSYPLADDGDACTNDFCDAESGAITHDTEWWPNCRDGISSLSSVCADRAVTLDEELLASCAAALGNNMLVVGDADYVDSQWRQYSSCLRASAIRCPRQGMRAEGPSDATSSREIETLEPLGDVCDRAGYRERRLEIAAGFTVAAAVCSAKLAAAVYFSGGILASKATVEFGICMAGAMAAAKLANEHCELKFRTRAHEVCCKEAKIRECPEDKRLDLETCGCRG